MLYHLLTPLADQHQFFNLFRYITFRTAWGMVTSLAICYALYPVVHQLHERKSGWSKSFEMMVPRPMSRTKSAPPPWAACP